MKMVQEIPWKRIAVEAVAIIASILIAFTIDAWWQDRTDKIIEVKYLQALREDLMSSIDLLDESEASQQRQVQYLESLLVTNSDTPYSEELRLWIEDGLWNVGTFQPQLSALQDLEFSGQVQIIENQAIRRALASIRQKIDALGSTQRDFLVSQQTIIDPFLVDNFNLSYLILDRAANTEIDLSRLGTDEFQSRVAFKISLRGEVRKSQDSVRRAFVETLELIDRELQEADGP